MSYLKIGVTQLTNIILVLILSTYFRLIYQEIPYLNVQFKSIEMIIKQLHKHREEEDFKSFYRKIVSYVPEVKEFIANSLKAAENEGQIDRGYYHPDDVLDEIYLEVFTNFDEEWDVKMLRYLLFKKAVDKINEKKAIEVATIASSNTGALLKEELDRLNEDFTTDGDGDLILNTELDDISYKQTKTSRNTVYMDASVENPILEKLKLDDAFQLSARRRASFGYLYTTIPHISKTIFELYAFANQTVSEIALILDIEEDKIKKVLKVVTERFKRV